MKEKKQKFTHFIGGELLDEVLEGILAAIMIVLGVGYFNIKNNWIEALRLLALEEGASGAITESIYMYNTITNSAFFMFFKTHGDLALALLVILAILGVIAKILTTKSKGELIKDFGKIILVPGIVGIVSLIIINLLTVNSINDLMAASEVSATAGLLSNLDGGAVIFNMMGVLFLFGLLLIIIGSVLYFVTRNLGGKPFWLFLTSKLMTFLGFFAFGFFLLIRILAIDVITKALGGTQILKVFAFGWYITRQTFIISLVIFGFGYVLYTYGNELEKKHRRMQIRQLKMQRIQALRQTPQMGQHQQQQNVYRR